MFQVLDNTHEQAHEVSFANRALLDGVLAPAVEFPGYGAKLISALHGDIGSDNSVDGSPNVSRRISIDIDFGGRKVLVAVVSDDAEARCRPDRIRFS